MSRASPAERFELPTRTLFPRTSSGSPSDDPSSLFPKNQRLHSHVFRVPQQGTNTREGSGIRLSPREIPLACTISLEGGGSRSLAGWQTTGAVEHVTSVSFRRGRPSYPTPIGQTSTCGSSLFSHVLFTEQETSRRKRESETGVQAASSPFQATPLPHR